MSRRLMRWSASLARALALLVGAAAPAGAAAVPVSGSFTGTGTLVGSIECPTGERLGTSSDSTGDLGALGPAEIHLVICLDQAVSPTNFSTFGSFTLTGGGGSISGDVTGTNEANKPLPGPWPFDLTLTVTSDTGEIGRASCRQSVSCWAE